MLLCLSYENARQRHLKNGKNTIFKMLIRKRSIEVGGKFIGLQIKPVESGVSLNDDHWYEMHEKAHKEIIDEIKAEIEPLMK
jgi:hypothetical protein